jgi:hypothetical protein
MTGIVTLALFSVSLVQVEVAHISFLFGGCVCVCVWYLTCTAHTPSKRHLYILCKAVYYCHATLSSNVDVMVMIIAKG